jgi:hypothetical protein
MTGVDFTAEFVRLIGEDFSGYAGGAIVLNARYLKAMYLTVDDIYRDEETQKGNEQLAPFTILANPITPAGGGNKQALGVTFNHLLYAAGTYSVLQNGLSVVSFDLTKTPVEINFNKPWNFRSTEYVIINTVNSYTVPDTAFNGYLKQLTATKYTLFVDKFLSQPASAATFGTVVAGTTLYSVWRKYWNRKMKPLPVDQKGSILGKPTVWYPRYQFDSSSNGGAFVAYPDNVQLPDKSFIYWNQFMIDELKTPTVLIDSQDNAISLEQFYTIPFLYKVMEKAAKEYAREKRDGELYNTTNRELVTQ